MAPKFKKKGKHVHMTTQDGEKVSGTVLEAVTIPEGKGKRIVLEKIYFESVNGRPRTYLRICYFMLGKNGRAKNKWVFGQYATMFKKGNLEKLIFKAKKKGII
jgi:hypothetical protein